jgi:hypothetical protein
LVVNFFTFSKKFQHEIQRLADFYAVPKTDEFQGHITHAQADFDSPIALVGEFHAFKTQIFLLRYSTYNVFKCQ